MTMALRLGSFYLNWWTFGFLNQYKDLLIIDPVIDLKKKAAKIRRKLQMNVLIIFVALHRGGDLLSLYFFVSRFYYISTNEINNCWLLHIPDRGV